MSFKVIFALVSLAIFTGAAPQKRADCGGGRSAHDARCCKWYDVLDDIQVNLFHEECGEDSHESLRLTFHDAIAYSPKMFKEGKFGGGGADGSVMHWSDIEMKYHVNIGVDEIVEAQRPFAIKHGVSFADFIQFAGAVGVSNCEGGPRVQFLAGRSNTSQPAPDFLVPEPSDSADSILARFADAGFTANEVIDLLASHSVAAQDHVDASIPATPLDSTFSKFDSQFFVETLLKGTLYPGNGSNVGEVMSPYHGEFRLQSDFELAHDPRTACEWQSLITDHATMVSKFEAAMAKLATVGNDVSELVDCSEVIPVPIPAKFTPTLPAGMSMSDIEGACQATPFPSLSAAPGPATTVARVPPPPKET